MTTKTWNGSNTDWNTAGDWSPTGVPQATDDAFINSGIVSLTTGDTPIDVNSITLSSTGGAPLLEIQEPGQTQSVAGAIAIEGNSSLSLDGANIGGAGGSTLTIGGTLTNSSTNGNGLDIGNTGITAADTVTVNGTGGLVNSSGSQINIEGNTSVQATLNVANAPAGFGTPNTETGTVFLEGDALLEFQSGQIITINGQLWLDGANARVADNTDTTTNSALTGLTTVASATGGNGVFFLENGASVSPSGNLTISGNGAVELDGPSIGGNGGSTLTVGGTLTDSSTNGNSLDIGNTGINTPDTLTVNGTGGLVNTGFINIEGNTSVLASLNVANAAAGFGTTGVETGTVFLQNGALVEFASGQINTINGQLWLDGANSRVVDSGATTTNSALTGLTTVASATAGNGFFFLENGASVSPSGNLSISGSGAVELDGASIGGSGGSTLTVAGTLTNDSTNGNGLDIGNTGISTPDRVTASGLSNTGTINMFGGSVGATADLTVNGAATNSGAVNINNFSELDVTGGNTYTQTAGNTTVAGTLAAAIINVTGGTLDFTSALVSGGGTGSIEVGGNAIAEFGAAVDAAQTMTFTSRVLKNAEF
jgi:hypothetical protein